MVEMTKLVGPNLLAECDGTVTDVVETPVVVYLDVATADTTLTWSTNEEYSLQVQTKGLLSYVLYINQLRLSQSTAGYKPHPSFATRHDTRSFAFSIQSILVTVIA